MLDPVAPNPAHGALRLRFGIPHPTPVRLEVFDVTGQRITTLLDGTPFPAGYHAVVWRGTRPDGSRVPSGVYFCRLAADRVTRVVRAVFVP
jgi:hypothetical protein